MLRRLSVRGKILAALAVPVFVLFIAATIISAQSLSSARVAAQTHELVDALTVQDAAGKAFAVERALSIYDSGGPAVRVAIGRTVDGAEDAEPEQAIEAFYGLVDGARASTDDVLDRRDTIFNDLNLSALDDEVQTVVDRTIADREQLEDLRERIDADSATEYTRTSEYSELIDRAVGVQRTVALTSEDRALAQYLQAYADVDDWMAEITVEEPIVQSLLIKSASGETNLAREENRAAQVVNGGDAILETAEAAVDDLPGGEELPATRGSYANVRQSVGDRSLSSLSDRDKSRWLSLSRSQLDQSTVLRDDLRSTSGDLATDTQTSANTAAGITIAATLVAFFLSVLIATLIARYITRPLKRLTQAAGDIRDQLPTMVEQVSVPGQGPSIDIAPIAVESGDEVGQLATAFNEVNSTTIQVAREQAALRGSIAEMFVNVARRDQVLLNRQLAFLDDLERSEEDPNALSNLFRLDHLATRMRRNAESLLVLAGIDSGRRVRQPMPTSDVIRTASSEIELYDRIRLNLDVDPVMLGHNALNTAHLLAELLENATNFSEPHTPVEVSIERDAGAVRILIRDHGLGMTEEETTEASRRVRSSSASDAVGAQRLGLYVVGRLADRLGATVQFLPVQDGNGTLVIVGLPLPLFVAEQNLPLPEPTDPLSASTQIAAGSFVGAADTGQQPVAPATGSLPVRGGGPSTGALPVGEAPVAVPVDLEALTDGTTGTGMPRRRAAMPQNDSRPTTGSIVLPPMAEPTLPDELPTSADDNWMPPSEVQSAAAALPSRTRSEEPSVALDTNAADPAALLPGDGSVEEISVDADSRSAMFSSFRSMGALEDRVASGDDQAPASPAPAPAADRTWTPEAAPEPAPEPAQPGPFGDTRQWTPEPAPVEPEPESAPAEPAPAPIEYRHEEPEPQPAPAESRSEPKDEAFQTLPAFEDLMADLPTRRSLRESQRKKSRFGGKKNRDDERPSSGPSAAALASMPLATPRLTEQSTSSDPFGTRSSATAQQAQEPSQVAAPQSAPAPAPAPDPVPSQPAPAPQADAVWTPPEVSDDAAPLSAPSRTSSGVAPTQPAAESQQPSRVAGMPQRPSARATTESSGAGKPVAAQSHDSVEARSEWLASAVLYEEMTSLLRSGGEDDPFQRDAEEQYQPASMSFGDGLAPRRRSSAPPANDGPTATIDRDPEEMRTRLSAFQSGISRGRQAVTDEAPSTGAPVTLNDEPHSSAPAR
ncbi:Signal transduction histidine kinase [Paraoerskovia marina]|uniref:histidine kinase n=1 Tax=Paraoerskovia marina TaxID=545619 RepID=A0A1H1P655_9CELL|nr:Signal transduction histidine kinase [Paraoerskovia marina]